MTPDERRSEAMRRYWRNWRAMRSGNYEAIEEGPVHRGHGGFAKYEPPPDALAEAERAHALGRGSLTAELMGDPLPGRSALDKTLGDTAKCD